VRFAKGGDGEKSAKSITGHDGLGLIWKDSILAYRLAALMKSLQAYKPHREANAPLLPQTGADCMLWKYRATSANS
jgi:hypothetical protein